MAALPMGFPMGMRFRPTDAEKMTILLCKVSGLALPCGDFMIGTDDVYGEKEPWEIWGDSEDEVYFFTMLKKIGKNNKRYSRNVGNGGTWANKGQKTLIYQGGGGLIGYKRCFRYENKDDANNGTWLLKEYTLPENFHYMAEGKLEYKDYALCVLKRKLGSSKTSPPPQVGVFDLGSGSENLDQEESHACGLRDSAEQFVREEQSTNLPSYF